MLIGIVGKGWNVEEQIRGRKSGKSGSVHERRKVFNSWKELVIDSGLGNGFVVGIAIKDEAGVLPNLTDMSMEKNTSPRTCTRRMI